ncbi:hypothetical protein [Desulfallas thermosapovorans]|uniref:Protein RecA n=1 Tax=Desulfallas thermosapovorans DSM 6562 TaxID=1121431 RepID=A0A5S4ZR29_9FIRM|nr:recA DNA recombination protein [Desulfallas thermosapovorans DSM 6562]
MTKAKLQENSRESALERALAEIEKKYGKGAIMKLGEKGAKVDVEVIPSGILPLDIAVGIGGLPRGRVMEIYGPESSGKTTVALHVIAEHRKNITVWGKTFPSLYLVPVSTRNALLKYHHKNMVFTNAMP